MLQPEAPISRLARKAVSSSQLARGRFLVALRIDDRMPARVGNVIHSPALLAGEPPPGLELFRFRNNGEEFRGICDWESAISFWQSAALQEALDLVVTDVRFDFDRSSPLVTGGGSRDIPTGLLHAKPLIAAARLTGRLAGIGIHTADPALWERLTNSDDPRELAMGLLAAHETGEIAAMLREAQGLLELPCSERARWCWNWLAARSKASFTEACRVAVRDYRSRLASAMACVGGHPPRVLMRPAAWARLAQWCERQLHDCEPLGRTGPPIELLFRDGTQDAIWLRSLFADVETIDLERQALPASSYEYPSAAERAGSETFVDRHGFPCIGAFVKRLRVIHDIESQANHALRAFPIELPSPPRVCIERTLLDAVPEYGDGKLSRALVVFFQIVRALNENQKRWDDRYDSCEWDPERCEFVERHPSMNSLRNHLERLHALMRKSPDLELRELLCTYEWMGRTDVKIGPWMRWHVERLVDAGAIRFDAASNAYEILRRTLAGPPPLPSEFSGRGFIASSAIKSFLTQSLGFSEVYGPRKSTNDHGIVRVLENAFGLKNESAANKLIEDFIEGRGPGWLRELCSDFAVERLQWIDRATWPACLRGAGATASDESM